MTNAYYNHSTYPSPNAPGSSAALRAELNLIMAGFDLLPTLAGNGYKVAMVNAAGTAIIASAALQSLAITGSTIDSTTIGATTRAAGSFTNLSVNGTAGMGTSVTIGGGAIDATTVGATTPSTGAFTTLSATSATVGGATVVTTTATQTLTNKSISGATNTLTNIGNASLTSSAVTIGSTSVSLGATATTLAGLTSVTSTSFVGALTGNASTVTNGVYTSGSYADPAWITSLAGSKVSGNITGNAANVTGTVAIANGGTGATTAAAARTNVLPSYTGNAGKALIVNGGETDVAWTALSGSGTVTSVAVSGGTTGLTTSGGPVTASGTITLAGTLAVANGGTGATTAAAGFNALSPITTAGDLIIGNGVNSATRLAIGANAQVLTSNGTTASWQTPTTGVTVAADNTWTGIQTFTNSKARLLGSSTGYTTFTSANSSALNYTLTIPAVTDTVAVLGAVQSFTAAQTFAASGVRLLGSSTGYTTFASANASATNYTLTFPATTDTLVTVTSADTLTNKIISGLANTISNVSLTAAVTGTLPVANGGTGVATLTGIVKGNGTGAFSAAAEGTDYVTPTGSETLTNKTLTTPVLSASISNTAGALGFGGGSLTIGSGSGSFSVATREQSNTYTGVTQFQNASGVTILASTTTTQDGIVINGRAGGTTSARVTLTPGTLTASRAVTFPDAAGELVLTTATQTLTGKTLTSPIISSISNTGTLTLPTSTDTLVGRATTDTLTNKRFDPRVSSTTSAASISPDVASFDQYCLTAQAVSLTVNAPTGTPVNGTKLMFRILDNGVSRTITWNATYTAIGVPLPAATTASKMTYVGCIYNAANTRWDVIAVSTQA